MKKISLLCEILFFCCFLLNLNAQQTLKNISLEKPGDSNFFIPLSLSQEDWTYLVPEEQRNVFKPIPRYQEKAETSRYLFITVKNPGPETFWYLELREQLEWVEIHYRPSPDADWISLSSGDMVPMKERNVLGSNIVFPLELKADTITDIYIKIMDYQYKYPYLRVISPSFFVENTVRKSAVLVLMYSLMFIAALYNVVLFLTTKNRMHLYYATLMICMLITIMGKHRMLSALFFPGTPYGYFVYIFFNSIAVVTALLFIRRFFSIAKKTVLNYVILGFSGMLLCIAAVAIVYSRPLIGDIMNFVIIPALLLMLGTTVKKSIKGDKPSKYVLISFIPIVLGFLFDNLTLYMRIPLSFSFNLILIGGIGAHIILANYGIILRQSEIRKAYAKLRVTFDEMVETQVKQRTKELETHASQDPLTSLLNRKSLDEKILFLEKENERAQTIGIVFIDIDDFKHFNDEFGHNTGDLILKETAWFLKENTREGDSVYRYGGDEFIILMPGADDTLVQSVSSRLIERYRALTKPLYDEISIRHESLSLSIGGCCWSPQSEKRLWDAVHCADVALLQAKRTGKDKLVFQR